MQKTYPAVAIANYFIAKNAIDPSALTHLKLQKLLYYAQGWYLANYRQPLFEDNIEAWKYGPVVYAIYNALRGTGDAIIYDQIPYGYYSDTGFVTGTPVVDSTDKQAQEFLDLFWEKFSKIDAWKLVNATHMPGTPWYDVCQAYSFNPPNGVTIPTELIEKHFKSLMPPSN